jgi:hypothetical protein
MTTRRERFLTSFKETWTLLLNTQLVDEPTVGSIKPDLEANPITTMKMADDSKVASLSARSSMSSFESGSTVAPPYVSAPWIIVVVLSVILHP